MDINGFYKLQNKKIIAFGRKFNLDLIQSVSDTDKTDIWVLDTSGATIGKESYNPLRLTVDFSHPTKLPIMTRVCISGRGDEAPNGWTDRERVPPQFTLKSLDAFTQWIVDYMTFDLGEDWFTTK